MTTSTILLLGLVAIQVAFLCIYLPAVRRTAKIAAADQVRLDFLIQHNVGVVRPDPEFWVLVRGLQMTGSGHDLRAVIDAEMETVNG